MMAKYLDQKMIQFEIAMGEVFSGTSWVGVSLFTSKDTQASCPDHADTTCHRQ